MKKLGINTPKFKIHYHVYIYNKELNMYTYHTCFEDFEEAYDHFKLISHDVRFGFKCVFQKAHGMNYPECLTIDYSIRNDLFNFDTNKTHYEVIHLENKLHYNIDKFVQEIKNLKKEK